MSWQRVVAALVIIFALSGPVFGAGNETINPLPDSNQANFRTQSRTFWQNELPMVMGRYFPLGWVRSGGVHGVEASCTSDAFAVEAFTDQGKRVQAKATPTASEQTNANGTAAIDYSVAGCNCSNPGSDVAWVAVSAITGNSSGNYNRVAGSNYFVDCTSATEPTLPSDFVRLMKVTITNGAIAAVRTLTNPKPFSTRVINVVDECGVTPMSDSRNSNPATVPWASQTPLLDDCIANHVVKYYDSDLGAESGATRNVLYFPTGQYYLATTWEIPDNITIKGDGKFASIFFSNTGFADIDGLIHFNGIGGAPSTIEGFTVSIFGACPVTCVGIKSSANGTYIKDVWVSGFQTGVWLGSTLNELHDFEVELNTTGIFIDSNNAKVRNGECFQNTQCIVVDTSAAPANDAASISISNVEDAQSGANGFAFAGRNANVSNISCWSNDGSKYSNACVYASSMTNLVLNGLHANIANAQHTTATGLLVENSTNVVVNGCLVRGWRDGALFNNNSSIVMSGCLSVGNRRHGVFLSNNTYIAVSGNVSRDNGTVGAVDDAGFNVVNSAGFALATITGNIASQTGGGPQDYGFAFNNTGASAQIMHSGNIAVFNAVADVIEPGSDAEDQGIRQFGVGQPTWRAVLGSASLNFANLTPGSCEQVTMAATGARVANIDQVYLGMQSNAQILGIVYNAYVSADDVVTVQACNVKSAGDVDIPMAQFTASVHKLVR